MKKITLAFLLFAASNVLAQTPQDFFPTSDYNGTRFGRDVKISNGEILVSSANPPTQIGGSGRVFLFKLTENTLQQTNTFYPADALVTDNFGASISIENDLIAIGSPYHDANFENAGAVYLYKRTNGTWEFLQKITATDAEANDNFGSFVKIHNGHLLISAINDDIISDSGENNGSVYDYTFDGTSWVSFEKITVQGKSKFGSKIEAEGNKIIISSYETQTNGMSFATYSYTDTGWQMLDLILTLGSLEETIQDFSLSNDRLFVVSNILDNNGKIYILDSVNNIWGIITQINLDQFPDQLYTKIEVSDDTMLLGSTAYILQQERKFPLLLYKKVNDVWNYQDHFYGVGEMDQDDHFGGAIALDGNLAIVGAPEEGPISTGKAYYFDTTLGVTGFEKNSIQLYPNPSTDLVYIKNNSGNTITNAEIYSVTGSLLSTQYSNLEQLSLADFPVGMYFIRLTFDGKITENHKIIKK